MIALLKYGSGFPFNRIEKLQAGFGIPLAASTQWDIVEAKAKKISAVYEEFVRQAAQGEVMHNDDTAAKILEFMSRDEDEYDDSRKPRKGMFTTGVLSQIDEHRIALYFTGRKHAGENMAKLLSQRDFDRGPPIQMCDALARNLPKEFKVLLANCLAHARRRFIDVTELFPEECRFVIETLKDVYKNEATAKQRGMSEKERLAYHQGESGPLMKSLKDWMEKRFEQRQVEPNSSLGEAISYVLKHWEALTLFLKVPGAPLDNNICEQVLKRAILHRKNSLFFKTQNGAYVGDLYMSLIHTCNLADANPFDYLTELERNSAAVQKNPERWLPWTYDQTLNHLQQQSPGAVAKKS
jgi:transposase